MQPNTMLRGKEGMPRKRMASPHSPSKVMSRGTSANCCASLVSFTWFSSKPPEKSKPPTLYSCTTFFSKFRLGWLISGAMV